LDTLFDIAIIGAGPAGAMAAYTAAQAGLKCVLIEKETLPRYKICGGGVVGRGIARIPFDVSSVVHGQFRSIEVRSQHDDYCATATHEQPIISMVMRDEFDAFLVEQALAQGAQLLAGQALQTIKLGDSLHQLTTSQTTVHAKAIIAADGATSPTAKMAGWAVDTRECIPALEYEVHTNSATQDRLSESVRFDMDVVTGGYGWNFPKRKHLSLGVCALEKKGKLQLKAQYQDYVQSLQIHEIAHQSQHGYIIPIGPRTDGFVKNRVFLTGDAAGLADPMTAEGISNAIASGIAAAQALMDAKMDCAAAEQLYLSWLKTHILDQNLAARRLTHWFYANTTLRNLLLRTLGTQLANRMTGIFMGEALYPENIMASLQRRLKMLITRPRTPAA
jgi:geranylgeranyl reductase family protein